MIWKTTPSLDDLNASLADTLGGHVGMRFEAIDDESLRMSMPVDARTRQPFGLLHGGATAALIETIGSVASSLCVDLAAGVPVGTELSCSHLRSARRGRVWATCTPWRVGRSQHVWAVEVVDDQGKRVCVGRLTVSIVVPRG